MVRIEINSSEFHDMFHKAGRGKQFSYEALNMLYTWCEEMQESDADYEVDVIGLCCDFAEIKVSDINKEYSECETIEDLEEQTIVLGETKQGTVVFRQF